MQGTTVTFDEMMRRSRLAEVGIQDSRPFSEREREMEKSRATSFKRLDRVRLGSGQIIIVTGFKPKATANPWLGVLEKGHGKEYKFGYKHNPVKIGEVTEDHPALRAKEARAGGQSAGGASGVVDPLYKSFVDRLIDAVLSGNTEKARLLAETLKAADPVE